MAMECSLLYVSRATITPYLQDADFDATIATARAYNARIGITGGLVRAAGHSAHMLEGPTEAVKMQMQCIESKLGHSGISVLRVAAGDKRQFDDWSLAYDGESSYLAGQIASLLGADPEADPERVDRLATLIVALASM